jgi:hypothetical protein
MSGKQHVTAIRPSVFIGIEEDLLPYPIISSQTSLRQLDCLLVRLRNEDDMNV